MKKPNKSEPLKGIHFTIDNNDIFNGRSDLCPVEWAMRRVLKPGLSINVGSTHVLIREPGGRACERFLPKRVRYFVRDFDVDRDDVEPMGFCVRLPLWVRRTA